MMSVRVPVVPAVADIPAIFKRHRELIELLGFLHIFHNIHLPWSGIIPRLYFELPTIAHKKAPFGAKNM